MILYVLKGREDGDKMPSTEHARSVQPLKQVTKGPGVTEAHYPGIVGANVDSQLDVLDALQKLGARDASTEWDVSDQHRAALRLLPSYVRSYFRTSRQGIRTKFVEIYREWASKGVGRPYVVSHGYSKTVRDVLRDGLPEATIGVGLLPDVFFIREEEYAFFDTQLMEYEVRHEWGRAEGERGFRELSVGETHVLVGLVKPGQRVLVVLGAECFAEWRKEGVNAAYRFVHPWSIARELESLREGIEGHGGKCLVMVVAEEYKDASIPRRRSFAGKEGRESPLQPQEGAWHDTQLNREHWERLGISTSENVHLIVTEKSTIPENWRGCVEARGGRPVAQATGLPDTRPSRDA
jgi:hypothetical protein